MKTKAIWIIISVVAAAGIINLPLFFNGEQNNRLNIKGSSTVCPIIMRCLDLFKKDYPDALITVTKSGSGSGIAALLDGTADIAMSSRPLTEKEKNIITGKGLKIDRIVIEKYPLSRELFLFIRDDFSELKKKFLEFVLSPEGQRIVNKEGFVAVIPLKATTCDFSLGLNINSCVAQACNSLLSRTFAPCS